MDQIKKWKPFHEFSCKPPHSGKRTKALYTESSQYVVDTSGQYVVDTPGQYVVDTPGQYVVDTPGQYVVDTPVSM